MVIKPRHVGTHNQKHGVGRISQYQKLLTILTVIALGAGAAIYFVQRNKASREEEASYTFKEVREIFDGKVQNMESEMDAMAALQGKEESKTTATYKTVEEKYQKAVTVLNTIITKYPETKAAKLAHYYLANAHFFLKQYDEAIKDYEVAYQLFSSKPDFVNLINDAMAHTYEQKNDLDKAIGYYTKIADGKNTLLKDYSYYNMGRCYEMKMDIKKAGDYYKRLKTEFPKSPMVAFVDKRLSVMNIN